VDKIKYKKRPNPLTPFPAREGGRLPSLTRRGIRGEVLQVIVPNYLTDKLSPKCYAPTLIC